jgi:hypothetical protein
MNFKRRNKMHMKQIMAAWVGVLLLAGCQERDLDGVSTKAGLEAQQQIAADNANRTQKAKGMESDLETRHRFYQATRGVYEGVFQTESGEFNIRLTLVPSLPPFDSDRVRTLEEIASDLSNLHFNVQVVQWNPASKLSAVGCRIENVHPDLRNGQIEIAAESCPNFYLLKLSDGALRDPYAGKSGDLSRQILGGGVKSVERIVGRIQPTTNASTYEFSAVRVQQ